MPAEYELRPYQQQAYDAVLQSWDSFDRVLACSFTGSGKTRLGAAIAADWNGNLCQKFSRPRRILWIAHRDELLMQAAVTLALASGEEPGWEKADLESESGILGDKIVVASIQTLQHAGRLENVDPRSIGLVVLDEAHHAVAAGYEKVLAAFPHAKLLGITATTDRQDQISLGRIFQDCPFDYELMDGIADGWACDIKCAYIQTDLDFSSVRVSDDVSAEDVGKVILDAGRAGLYKVAAATVRHAGDRPTIVFCPTVDATRALAEVMQECTDKGVVAVWGAMPTEKREQALREYGRGEVQYLLNCMLLTEGWDSPRTAHIVIARPTKSRMLYSQIIGRGTRGGRNCPVDGKTDLLVTDLVGAGFKCKLVHAGDVLGGAYDDIVVEAARKWCKEKAEKGETPSVVEELKKAAGESDELRRQQRMGILAAARFKRKTIDPFSLLDIANPASEDWWQGWPPTERQIEALAKAKIPTAGLNRKEASVLLDTITQLRAAGMASYAQRRLLRSFGYIPDMTSAEASDVLDDLFSRPKSRNGRPKTTQAEFWAWKQNRLLSYSQWQTNHAATERR